MWPPAKIMTIREAPMAMGASGPAPLSITVQPMVRTRKKVPISSTRYLFIFVSKERVKTRGGEKFGRRHAWAEVQRDTGHVARKREISARESGPYSMQSGTGRPAISAGGPVRRNKARGGE